MFNSKDGPQSFNQKFGHGDEAQGQLDKNLSIGLLSIDIVKKPTENDFGGCGHPGKGGSWRQVASDFDGVL